MRYISVSDMRFKDRLRLRKKFNVLFALSFLFFTFTSTFICFSEVIDRAVAYVDDTAITLSEFQENYIKMKKEAAGITEEDVINSMINRLLLIKEAKKIKLEAPTDDELLKDYIDIKIRSLIIIKEDAVKQFYMEHINEFRGRDYLSVRDEIENYLFEMQTNRQLKRHLEDLRANADIKINIGIQR